jgi:hypothetical protein
MCSSSHFAPTGFGAVAFFRELTVQLHYNLQQYTVKNKHKSDETPEANQSPAKDALLTPQHMCVYCKLVTCVHFNP